MTAAWLAALALSACLGGGTKPSFYALSSSGDAGGLRRWLRRPALGLAVGPIDFPRYLDRPELVTRDAANRLVVADAHRWGGSLRTEILRVVADDLGRLLGTSRVVMYPTEPRFSPTTACCSTSPSSSTSGVEQVTLLARWTIASSATGALVVEEIADRAAVASASCDDVVAADSAASPASRADRGEDRLASRALTAGLTAGGPRGPPAVRVIRLLGQCRPGGLDLRLHRIEVEARALLHGRELDGRHRQLRDLLLHEHEAPELVLEPIEVLLRTVLGAVSGPARALERIETQVDQVWHVRVGLLTQPPAGLVDEAILVVVDPHRAELAFAEIEDLVTIRRALCP